MEPSYYAIIPANVRYDSALIPAAKLLYGEITALCNKDGYCWAENAYFAELYGVSIFTISRWVSQLQNGNYIDLEIIKSDGNKRKITLAENVNRSCGKAQKVLTKNAIALAEKRKSIYRMNNTINNTINREENALAFFEKNSPSEWENFLMRFRKKFTDPEWEKFREIFDCKIIEEEIEFTTKKIGARLTRFAINYLAAMEGKKGYQETQNAPEPKRNIFKG